MKTSRSYFLNKKARLEIASGLNYPLTGKTGIASIARVAVNGKHVAGWRFW